MASRIGPRSVKDATRFTSTIPHATSKSATSAAAAPKPSRIPGETPEQRVRRLRQAHLAAQKAQVSNADRVIDASRRFFDVAHRWTVGGLVMFTVVAGVVSVYSVWDMLRYNRARRAEWIEAQKKFEADELATARLAYLKGDATEEQIALVEEANQEAEEKGIKLPPLLSPPEHRTHFEEHVKPAFEGGKEVESQGKGILGFLWGGSSSSEANASATAVQSVGNLAKDAWEKEKENQRNGGSLDQLGLETGTSAPEPKKKGWW
ncbi:cytochrome oxidase c assembly domain-containing [Trichoderma arundinaceum]|uniref:Cytochrome oxidase c assembly domain-containing n=1 Tax=Trichoderma arundinaceum TaxID=490622 RepID=A0A395NWT1_TRIAR|nr:cytochrome oxidase c assembly domain-containing [Trichoderma arundinaceum]